MLLSSCNEANPVGSNGLLAMPTATPLELSDTKLDIADISPRATLGIEGVVIEGVVRGFAIVGGAIRSVSKLGLALCFSNT